MEQLFNIEYIDVIQYLNNLVDSKNYNDYAFIKSNTLIVQDIRLCENILNQIINLINRKIKENDFNRLKSNNPEYIGLYSNISTFDGFEKVQRELGLAPNLYPKYFYNTPIELLDYKIINLYRYNNNLKYELVVKIKRNNKDNGLNNHIMTFKIIVLFFYNKIIVKDINILGFTKVNEDSNYFYLNGKLDNSDIIDIRKKQNIIMQDQII